jgi:hypothetical protein
VQAALAARARSRPGEQAAPWFDEHGPHYIAVEAARDAPPGHDELALYDLSLDGIEDGDAPANATYRMVILHPRRGVGSSASAESVHIGVIEDRDVEMDGYICSSRSTSRFLNVVGPSHSDASCAANSAVLGRFEFAIASSNEEHLPDAIHLPLQLVSRESVAVLDRDRPVIVYCWDGL